MKLLDLNTFISKFEKRYDDIVKKYTDKLIGLNEEKDQLISSAKNQSEKFINDKKNQIDITIAEVEKNMNEKLQELDEQINKWINSQKKKIEKNITTAMQARLGIEEIEDDNTISTE